MTPKSPPAKLLSLHGRPVRCEKGLRWRGLEFRDAQQAARNSGSVTKLYKEIEEGDTQKRMHLVRRGSLLHLTRSIMAETRGVKPSIRIDVTSDTVCPWCFVGKLNLEKAMDASKDKYNFEVKWHPFFLNPNADIKGVDKVEYYNKKFGKERAVAMKDNMTKVFRDLGLSFKLGGLTGSTLDSHRLITLAGHQGLEKQNALVEELFLNYFTQEKYIGDRKVLLEAAAKVGIDGAEEWLNNPNAGIEEIQHDLKQYAQGVSGVPNFLINGQQQLNGAQPLGSFLRAFELASAT